MISPSPSSGGYLFLPVRLSVTTVETDNAGMSNVVPNEASITVNVRIPPKMDVEGVLTEISRN